MLFPCNHGGRLFPCNHGFAARQSFELGGGEEEATDARVLVCK